MAGCIMQGTELTFLSQWQNFIVIIGTAAATLTGLMFVVTTLIAGIDAHLSTLNGQYPHTIPQPLCNLQLFFCLPGYSALPGKRSRALVFCSAWWAWGWYFIRLSSCDGCGGSLTINRHWRT